MLRNTRNNKKEKRMYFDEKGELTQYGERTVTIATIIGVFGLVGAFFLMIKYRPEVLAGAIVVGGLIGMITCLGIMLSDWVGEVVVARHKEKMKKWKKEERNGTKNGAA